MADASSIIEAAVANAESLGSSASSTLEGAISRLGSPSYAVAYDLNVNIPTPGDFSGTKPTYEGNGFVAPRLTASEPLIDVIPLPEYGIAPILTANRPTFVDPTKPSQLADFNKSAPTLDAIVIPPAPDGLSVFNVVAPTLTDIVVPAVPDVAIPEFDATMPNTEIVAPTDFANTYAQDYAYASVSMRRAIEGELDAQLLKINPEYKAQMAVLEAKLATYIAGGTAMTDDVEQAIYNRARDKVNAEYLKSRDMIMVEGAKRGFTIPGGAQYSALTQARQQGADNNARAAVELAIKHAELEQANIQFAISQSSNLRQAVMQTMTAWFNGLIQLNGQGLEYARDLLNAAVAVYETLVKIATAQIEIYKAEAQVYETRLRAVLSIYDVYQAQVKALEAQVNVDTAKVSAYTAQVQAYGALANAYKAVIEGTMAKAELERLKVDIFQAEVQSYSAQVGAKQAEWQGFSAQVNGEAAKQEAFKSQVGAYAAEVSAYSSKISAYNTLVNAVSSKNESAYKVYNASVQAYTSLVSGASAAANAEVSVFNSKINAYVAEASAFEAGARAKIAAASAVAQSNVSAYNSQVQAAISNAQSYNSYMTNAAQVAVSAAGIYGNMASAAMSGVMGIGSRIDSSTV